MSYFSLLLESPRSIAGAIRLLAAKRGDDIDPWRVKRALDVHIATFTRVRPIEIDDRACWLRLYKSGELVKVISLPISLQVGLEMTSWGT